MNTLTLVQTEEDAADRAAYEAERRRKALRAERARKKYAEDRANGWKKPRATGNPRPRKPKYDVDDYVEEWVFLTSMGLRASTIIARSNPSYQWFFENVRPLVNDALCETCGDHFSPSRTGMMTKCHKQCGLAERNKTLWLVRR